MTRLILAAALVLSAGAARAQSAAPKKWKDSAEASFVNANGNSRTTTTSAKNLFSFAFSERTGLDVEGGALGARSQGQVTAEQYYAGERLQHKVDDRDYGFERYRWDKNRFAGIANRHDFSLGAGRELWKTAKDLLTGEGGPGYVNEERVNDKRRSFASARAYAKYTHEFSAAAKFGQDAEYVQSLKDKRDNRFGTVTDLTTALSSVFSLKTSFTWKHVSQPPPGAVKDDTITAVALIANF